MHLALRIIPIFENAHQIYSKLGWISHFLSATVQAAGCLERVNIFVCVELVSWRVLNAPLPLRSTCCLCEAECTKHRCSKAFVFVFVLHWSLGHWKKAEFLHHPWNKHEQSKDFDVYNRAWASCVFYVLVIFNMQYPLGQKCCCIRNLFIDCNCSFLN